MRQCDMNTHVLVTGGTGFLGSQTVVKLLDAGHTVTIVDDLSNSKADVVDRIAELAGVVPHFAELDICDEARLDEVFRRSPVDAVIHFAGLKAVGESVADPLRYYDVNLRGTITLLRVMKHHGVRQLVFSSSATVYGDAVVLPLVEDAPLSAASPYGRTKLGVETLLFDLCAAEPDWHVMCLRYFNPVGAHPSARLGEDPLGIPNNLVPFALQVASGQRPELVVFGDDYPTHDGTCIRDYIHVLDLADGHLAALRHLGDNPGCHAINLGTGEGHTVFEVISELERAIGRPIPHRVGPRRPGDVPVSYADVSKADTVLGWRTTRSLADMCTDAWRWRSSELAPHDADVVVSQGT
jgi:UDP-glucose 4-epimerase